MGRTSRKKKEHYIIKRAQSIRMIENSNMYMCLKVNNRGLRTMATAL
jgi:hypothetical protein